ncbi:CxxC motif-containing protein [Kineothrix alysoides]|uniref:CxxC motif-containing protein n=1 Tax=Kineothrix alysoides TaxID=1469948 RepID=A0A4R1R2E7_9FIRM|nr:DUF1667 domain-containing protein [Kineothrix alysoides]TCL59544.1 CxxC motif-containing protein [Kineothrix alysoides]
MEKAEGLERKSGLEREDGSERKDGFEKTEGLDKRELICVRCPVGCMLTVTVREDGTLDVKGNSCGRGEEYARKELTDPTRIVTTTVRVRGGRQAVVPVKTRYDIPKGKVMECIEALKEVEAEAPIFLGEVILSDAAGTGVDVVATKSVERTADN